jgi:amino acid transporter
LFRKTRFLYFFRGGCGPATPVWVGASYKQFFIYKLHLGFKLIFIIHISVALAFGAKESSVVNNLFTFLNLGVVLYVIITGAFKGEHFIGLQICTAN